MLNQLQLVDEARKEQNIQVKYTVESAKNWRQFTNSSIEIKAVQLALESDDPLDDLWEQLDSTESSPAPSDSDGTGSSPDSLSTSDSIIFHPIPNTWGSNLLRPMPIGNHPPESPGYGAACKQLFFTPTYVSPTVSVSGSNTVKTGLSSRPE